jgi:hypothetical protein
MFMWGLGLGILAFVGMTEIIAGMTRKVQELRGGRGLKKEGFFSF